MIGNDIVDLKQAAKDSNWKRPRFLDKVFTQKEQLIISSSENKVQMVWLLWSMKEAAYKAYVRETQHSFFNPKRIQCQLGLNNKGVVCIDNKTYNMKSVITSEYVHSIAKKNDAKFPEIHLFKVNNSKLSETVKTRIVNHIASKKGKDLRRITLRKTELGVPNVYVNKEQIVDALTISHHGKFGAFAMC